VEYAGEGRAKYSFGKQTLPGAKQIFRRGSQIDDVLELRTARASGKPLLQPVWRDGERLWHFDVSAARARCQRELASVPAARGESERDLVTERAPALAIGPELQALAARVRARDLQR
jgi:nicotinate phosphoribosyltransferase